jgi:fibronectin-binding autotransporter adhesin
MNRLLRLSCCVAAAGLLLSLPPAAQAASVWTNAGSDFNTTTNWSPAAATGADLVLDGSLAAQLNTTCSFTPKSLTIGSAAAGTLNLVDGVGASGSLTLSGNLTLSAAAVVSTVNLSGNARLSVNDLSTNTTAAGGVCNFTAGGTSHTTLNSTAGINSLNRYGKTNLTFEDSATFTANTGYFDLGAGTAVASGTSILSVQDSATLNVNHLIIGDNGSSDCLRVTGGNVNINGASDVKYIGLYANSYGEMNVSGGAVTVPTSVYNVSLAVGGWNYMAAAGARGVVTVSGNGVIDGSAALYVCNEAGSVINIGAAGTGGGTLKTSGFTSLGGNSSGTVNFHGGTVIANASASYAESIFNVYSEGATIQVNSGATTSVNMPLEAPAGEGVTAIPVTSGGSGYTVAPLVKISTDAGTASDVTAVAVIDTNPLSSTYKQVTGITITNPGTNHYDTEALNVQLLGGDGSGAVAGTAGVVTLSEGANIANNVSGGLTKTGVGELALNRDCTYTGPTDIQTGTLTLNNVNLSTSGITVRSGAALAGATPFFGPTTYVASNGTISCNKPGYILQLNSLSLEDGSKLNFTIDSYGYAGLLNVYSLSRVGTDPITVNVSYTGTLAYDAIVLQNFGGAIDENISFELPGGKPTIDSDDGIHAPATVYTDYAGGYVQLKAGGLLADLVPAWNNVAGGDWNDTTKWGTTPPKPYPQNGGDRAMFTNYLGSASIPINLNVSPTLSSMIFAGPDGESYTITRSDSGKSITLDSDIAKNWHITVLSGSHTVNADLSIAPGDGGAVVKVPVDSTLALGGAIHNLSGDAGFTFQSNGALSGSQGTDMVITQGVLQLNGANDFSGPVTMTGYGRLELAQPTSLGAGTAAFTLDGQLVYTDDAGSTTMVAIDRSITFAGAGYLDGIEVQSANVNLNFTGALSKTGTANAFRKTGAGTLTFSNAGANTLASGDFQIEEGAVVFENGAFTKAQVNIGFQKGEGDFFIGDTAGTSASLTVQDGASLVNQGHTFVGRYGATGALTVSGGTALHPSVFSTGGATWIGVDTSLTTPCHGTMELDDYAEYYAAHAGVQNNHVGFGPGSSGTITISDHAKLVCEGINVSYDRGLLDIGDAGATGEVTLNDSASLSVPNGLVMIGGNVSNNSSETMTGTKGAVTLNDSATFTAGRPVVIGGTYAEGVLTLNGGTFTAPALVSLDAAVGATINFNGGTLKAAASDTLTYYDSTVTYAATGLSDFIQGTTFTVNVMDNGAKIDTNNLHVTLSQQLKHAGDNDIDGGLTKLGLGALALTVAPTYTGSTDIQDGVLELNTGGEINLPGGITSSTGLGDLTVDNDVTLTTPSVTVRALTIGSARSLSPAPVPEPSTVVLCAFAFSALAWGAWRKRR